MSGGQTIHCRARLVDDCLDGEPTVRQFGAPGPGELPEPQSADGTYDPETNSIVCDACYMALGPYTASGRVTSAELPGAIERARAAKELRP